MQCPTCHFENPEESMFCGNCGAPLEISCPKCGSTPPPGFKFCNKCGYDLRDSTKRPSLDQSFDEKIEKIQKYLPQGLVEKILSQRNRIEGEKRQVTVMFCDMEGFTSLSEKLGPEQMYTIMDKIYELLIHKVRDYEGTVNEMTGDGVMALFGVPIALEDAPQRAIRSALAIHREISKLSEKLKLEKKIPYIKMRIGIHTGPVVVGTLGNDLRVEFKAVGDTVNLASRMESIADPGTVYITEATYSLVKSYTETTFIGEKQIKGKSGLQKVYRIENVREHAVRFDESMRCGLTPLTGRTKELTALNEYLNEAITGKTMLVLLMGEPGVGKSRLMYEFQNRLSYKKIFFLRSNCMSFGETRSFFPIIKLVESLFQINENNTQEEVEKKIEKKLELLNVEAEAKPFLLNLLSYPVKDDSFKKLDARIKGERTREIIVSLFQNRAKQSPTVLAIEDLHWIDLTSEQLLHQIITKETNLPLMLFCTARPSYNASWLDRKNAKLMKIQLLTKKSVKQMVAAILGSDQVADEINKIIIEKAGCNPFFTEEMTRHLIESKNLQKSGKTVGYVLSAGKVSVPTTILDLLQTKIDRLANEPKTIIQTAAVVGQRFSPEIVKYVSRITESFDDHVKELEKQDLIFPERIGDAIEYRFRHALFQDVVYDNLLKPRKEIIHQSIGEAIEKLYPEKTGEFADTLAHHWSNTKNVLKAVMYIVMSAEKSLSVYAVEDAHQKFKNAVELTDTMPGAVDDNFFADTLLKWARVFFFRHDYKGRLLSMERYLPKLEALGDKKKLSLFLSWLGESHTFGGRGEASRMLYEKAIKLGDEINDPECIAYASHGLLWYYSYWDSNHEQSDKMVDYYYRRGLESAKKIGDTYIQAHIHTGGTIFSVMRSRYEETREYCAKLTELGQKFNDDRISSIAHWGLAFCNNLEERFEEALANAEQSLRFAPDQQSWICASAAKGGALALTGKINEGFHLMREVRAQILQKEFILLLAGIDIPYGAVMVLAGQMQKGVNHIRRAMAHWASLGNYTQPVYGHVFLSDIYLKIAFDPPPPLLVVLKNIWFVLKNKPAAKRKAKYHLKKAVSKSKEYNMPGFLAKSLYGLGILSQAKKKKDEARSYYDEALRVAEKNQLFFAEKIKTALEGLEN